MVSRFVTLGTLWHARGLCRSVPWFLTFPLKSKSKTICLSVFCLFYLLVLKVRRKSPLRAHRGKSVCFPVCLFPLSLLPPACLPACLSVCLSVYLFSVCLSVCSSVCLSVFLSVFLYLSVCLSVCLSKAFKPRGSQASQAVVTPLRRCTRQSVQAWGSPPACAWACRLRR